MYPHLNGSWHKWHMAPQNGPQRNEWEMHHGTFPYRQYLRLSNGRTRISVQFFSRDLGMGSRKKVYYRPVSYKCTIMFGHGLSLSNPHFHLIACLMPESWAESIIMELSICNALVINGNWCPGGMLHLLLSNDPFHPLGMCWPFFWRSVSPLCSSSTNCNAYLLLNQWPWARIRIRAFTKVAVSAHYTIHSVCYLLILTGHFDTRVCQGFAHESMCGDNCDGCRLSLEMKHGCSWRVVQHRNCIYVGSRRETQEFHACHVQHQLLNNLVNRAYG